MRGPQQLDRLRDPTIGADAVREPDLGEKEQRRHVRKRVLWAATLETTDGTFDCIVLNVSRSGAKLRFKAPIAAQATIELVLGTFGKLKADVIWQRADKMGIRFCAKPEEVAKIIGEALAL